jgi:hypothetical protein
MAGSEATIGWNLSEGEAVAESIEVKGVEGNQGVHQIFSKVVQRSRPRPKLDQSSIGYGDERIN